MVQHIPLEKKPDSRTTVLQSLEMCPKCHEMMIVIDTIAEAWMTTDCTCLYCDYSTFTIAQNTGSDIRDTF